MRSYELLKSNSMGLILEARSTESILFESVAYRKAATASRRCSVKGTRLVSIFAMANQKRAASSRQKDASREDTQGKSKHSSDDISIK